MTNLRSARINMAALNVRGINDALLAEWLNHPYPEVRAIAAAEAQRRRAVPR